MLLVYYSINNYTAKYYLIILFRYSYAPREEESASLPTTSRLVDLMSPDSFGGMLPTPELPLPLLLPHGNFLEQLLLLQKILKVFRTVIHDLGKALLCAKYRRSN